MSMNLEPLLQQTSVMPPWRRGGFAAALALGLAGAFSGLAAVAGECSIEAQGENAYARVQSMLKKNLSKARDFGFESYRKIDIELLPGCVFKLESKFHVTSHRGQTKFKHFNAELTPKKGAPMGFKKLKLSVSSG
jgi:hypothetical protein